MSSGLTILDLRADLAALSRHPQAQAQDTPLRPASLTFHFSDVVAANRTFAAERRRLTSEAEHHLRKNWESRPGRPPIYGSRYQYHYVVFSDGQIALTNDLVVLWHCGNDIGNTTSISTHVMLGRGQRLTAQQRVALYALWDQLRAEHGSARAAVVGHCEWPRGTGPARVLPSFRPMPMQSTCPERTLFQDLAAYRAMVDDGAAGVGLYVLRCTSWVRPLPRLKVQRTSTKPQGALVEVLAIEVGDFVQMPQLGSGAEWAKTADGYIWLNQLRKL